MGGFLGVQVLKNVPLALQSQLGDAFNRLHMPLICTLILLLLVVVEAASAMRCAALHCIWQQHSTDAQLISGSSWEVGGK